MAAVFEAKGLTLGYRDLRLFQNLDLILNEGELICFMGPNGCGKSTLIRTLAGIQQPIAGVVPPKDETKLAVVLTDRVQSQHMTVEELIVYGRYPYLGWDLTLSQKDRDFVAECIDLVRVNDLVKKKINELSDGQMQMAMIARALAQDTPVLLLDEPTAHLDLNNRLEIMNLLRRLARDKNKSILLATHELDLALQTADRIWLADKNSIRIGIPEDLVLDGSFDSVFRFKGYDLKTGRVRHEVFRKKRVKLTGDGAVYLWTKNALERNGFGVDSTGELEVVINSGDWSWNRKNYKRLEDLLNDLNSEP